MFGRGGALLLPCEVAGIFVGRTGGCVVALRPTCALAPLFTVSALVPASVFTFPGTFPFTNRCWFPSYTIEESRLTVTGRLPALLVRIVRETRVGAELVANLTGSRVLCPGFFSTDHFCPAVGTVAVDVTLLPFTV